MRRRLTAELLIEETEVLVPVAGTIARETLPFALGRAAGAGFRRLRILLADDSPEPGIDRGGWPLATVDRLTLDGPFSRSRLLNYGAATSAASWIAMLDADVLLNPAFVRDGACHLMANYPAVVLPRIYYMQPGEGGRFRAGEEIAPGKRTIEACGGLVWLRRHEFISSGGLENGFVGWGADEFEFAWRWEAQGRPIYRPEKALLHLHHDRSARKRDGYFLTTNDNRRSFKEAKDGQFYDLAFRLEGVTRRERSIAEKDES